MTNGTNGKERKKIGGETPTDAMSDYAVPYGHGRAPVGVRTTVGVPPRLLPRGLSSPKAQRQARLPGVWPIRRAGVTRPDLSQSSDSTSRAGRSAGRLMPDAARERVAKPPAGTAYFAPRCSLQAIARPTAVNRSVTTPPYFFWTPFLPVTMPREQERVRMRRRVFIAIFGSLLGGTALLWRNLSSFWRPRFDVHSVTKLRHCENTLVNSQFGCSWKPVAVTSTW